MGARGSERGQMANSLWWDTDPNPESHGNRNTHGYGNTYGHSDSNFDSDGDDNSNCQSHCNAHSDTDGYSYSDFNADGNARWLCSRGRLLEKPCAVAGKSIAAW